MKVVTIQDGEDVCANCRHFVQHYRMRGCPDVLTGAAEVDPVNYGHCTEPRVKPRKPGDTCGRFER